MSACAPLTTSSDGPPRTTGAGFETTWTSRRRFVADLDRQLFDHLGQEILGSDDLDAAHKATLRFGRSLVRVVVDLGLMSEAQALTALSAVTGHTVWSERGGGLEAPPTSVDQQWLDMHRMTAAATGANELLVVCSDYPDPIAISALQAFEGSVDVVLATDEVRQRLASSIKGDRGSLATAAGVDELTREEAERVLDSENGSAVVDALNRTLTHALAVGASDLHVERVAKSGLLKLREAGSLKTERHMTGTEARMWLMRIKVLAGLDVAQNRLPQDGRFTYRAAGRSANVRVSTIPTLDGESAVLRLLDSSRGLRSFASLGLPRDVERKIEDVLRAHHGLFLVTGPTGSGKTTTLYACLERLVDGSRKIVSIEDPVETVIEGVTQIQVDAEHAMGFADALRAVLRHDPDVILVGEIRDAQTARTAIQAALTGHLVFSSLHTNSVDATVTRLRDLGVEDHAIADALIGVSAQRLCHDEQGVTVDAECKLWLARHEGRGRFPCP